MAHRPRPEPVRTLSWHRHLGGGVTLLSLAALTACGGGGAGGATAQDVFVSPLTTLVVEVAAAEGSTTAEALAKVQSQLGLAASPLTNFVAAGDADAARLARTVNTVILSVAKLADDASVPAAQRQALIGSVTTGDLSTLAALVQSSTGSTPGEVAAQVAAAVIAEHAGGVWYAF